MIAILRVDRDYCLIVLQIKKFEIVVIGGMVIMFIKLYVHELIREAVVINSDRDNLH